MPARKAVLLIVVVAMVLGAGVLVACRPTPKGDSPVPAAAAAPAPPGGGQRAPALTVTDLEGREIQTAGMQGNVVLVNFWAAWCTPCTDEVPRLIELQEKYRARGLRIIGYSMEDRESALREFYRSRRMNYPVVVGNAMIAEAYGGVLGLPMSLLIGRDGTVRAKYAGMADIGKLERDIVAQFDGQ